jgi:hypothetical protein
MQKGEVSHIQHDISKGASTLERPEYGTARCAANQHA